MIYLLSYLSDTQQTYPVKSYVKLEESTTNQSRLTTKEEDSLYLPDIFTATSNIIPSFFALDNCYPLSSLRFCKLYINSSNYAKVEIPFLPDSKNFNLFFKQAKSNELITKIEYTGEQIQAYYLRRL